jgi:hypothetical protein
MNFLKVLDSFGKMPSGIYMANFAWLGIIFNKGILFRHLFHVNNVKIL